ncbi:mannitol dehydrogenase family protein [Amantichitinum ursilacus]|uniref:Polyol:NADP oxidoreductase n=1 Tax=Amantichitinum ursilacus TaxID=857265 RepID=A0A0N0GMA4_9NEIS|nr:mannitol dehydrogenase family protein [Amantichitinum ursilacus]KPC50769.1 Polyol:NADP oxidoreductase [Amantichitinum ursilacus]
MSKHSKPAARLDRAQLPRLDAHTLGTWRQAPAIGIVHLGLGNFHRAHQALLTEMAMHKAGGDWAICGVNLLDDTAMQAALAPQENLYSVLIRDAAGEQVVVVQSIREVLVLPREPEAVMARLRDPATRIVSLTVTEKGYCYDARTGGLDLTHPAVQHDLAHPDQPCSVPGLLVAALRARRAQPFTVMSCDNLAHNGRVLRQVVIDFAAQIDPELAAWIAAEVCFPCTMVDRIAPATTDADRAAAELALGAIDAWPVPCERFYQWVIEDRFAQGRPAWEKVGATLTDDVIPYELAKLRMLNGTHSTIAYLSLLAGFETVDQAIADPTIYTLIRNMMTEEIAPTLRMPAGFDVLAYRDELLARYANPALKHRIAQISMDGSLKLPPRLLGTLQERLAAGLPVRRHLLAVAAWMRCLWGVSDHGQRFELSDPIAPRLLKIAADCSNAPDQLVVQLLGVSEIFSPQLAQSDQLRVDLLQALLALEDGALRAAKALG